jgi:hypothetical protein
VIKAFADLKEAGRLSADGNTHDAKICLKEVRRYNLSIPKRIIELFGLLELWEKG